MDGQKFVNASELIEQPEAPLIRELLAYWERKRAGRMAPRRSDIDPTELVPHLPTMYMIDVIDGGADFRYRLVGTKIVIGMGRDSTHKRLSDVYAGQPKSLAVMTDRLRQIVREKRPAFARGSVYWVPDRDFLHFDNGAFPLSDDGLTVNIILGEVAVSWP
jgi:hypothetical protein